MVGDKGGISLNDNSRTRNSSKNIISGIVNKLVLLILSFVSRKIFIVFIGIQYLGINGLFSNVLQLLSLADLGFGVAMAYSYYKPLAEKDKTRLAGLTTFYKNIYNGIAIAVAVIGIALIPFLKYIVNMDQDIPHLYLIYLISLGNTVFSYLFVYKSSIINADQKSYLINKISIYINVAKLILQCVGMVVFKNYFAYIIIEVISTIANNLVVSYTADKIYPYIRETGILGKEEKIDIVKNIKSVFIYKVSAAIMGGTDSIIMSKIVGTIVVGYYSNYLTITNQLVAFVQIIFSSLTASVGNLLTEDKKSKNYEVFKIIQMLSHYISAVVSTSVLVLIQDFISLWLGAEYLMSDRMVWAIAINLYFTVAMQPIWSYREASGLYKKTKYVMLVTAILNIVLSVVLGCFFGAEGIIIATVLSRLMTYFWYEPLLIYKICFKANSLSYYVDFGISTVIIVISYLLIQYIFSRVESISWLMCFMKAFATAGIVSLLYLVRYAGTAEFKQCYKKISNM